MFFRIILYLFLALFIWHIIKRLFIGSRNTTSFKRQQDSHLQDRSRQIDYNNVDDAEFEDIDNHD